MHHRGHSAEVGNEEDNREHKIKIRAVKGRAVWLSRKNMALFPPSQRGGRPVKGGQIFESHSVAGHWKYSEGKHILSIAAGGCPSKNGVNGCSLSPRKELFTSCPLDPRWVLAPGGPHRICINSRVNLQNPNFLILSPAEGFSHREAEKVSCVFWAPWDRPNPFCYNVFVKLTPAQPLLSKHTRNSK